MSKRVWALQVLVLVVLLSVFFGLIAGERGVTLGLVVVMPSLLFPSLIWLRNRKPSTH
jgi:hypothetical protein